MGNCARVAMMVAGAAGWVGCGGTGGGVEGKALLTGTACGAPISYALGGDERIVVMRRADETLEGLLVLDGELFGTEDQAAWAAYAAANDTLLLLAFDDPEPATPHRITAIFDSMFAGRGAGVLGFVEHGAGEIVDILALDLDATTIDVEFSIPVGARGAAYPPDFNALEFCQSGLVTGSFSGPFELMTF